MPYFPVSRVCCLSRLTQLLGFVLQRYVSGGVMNPAVAMAVLMASTGVNGSLSDAWLYWLANLTAACIAALIFHFISRCVAHSSTSCFLQASCVRKHIPPYLLVGTTAISEARC